MKPAASTIVIDDQMPSLERIEFGISDPRKMMKMGARQYSDPIMAVIRELACNAADAHSEAGNDQPIEITLPTVWDNKFIVKDYGSGMSREIFREVYTQFGFSTKEHTNDQTGSLGLGSKSPLAYTDTFHVTSIRDGYKTVAIVTRQPDWSIVLDIMDWRATNEHDGTTVTLEVQSEHVEEFKVKTHDLLKFWLPGLAKVRVSNGDFYEVEHHAGNQIADNLYEALEWNLSWIVMGNVPYRIINSNALFQGTRINPMNFVAYVPMSEEEGIDFTPSREDLEYTPRTKATLRKVITDFEETMLAKAEAELAGATTHAEAYEIWTKWTGMLGGNLFADLEFKGDKFQDTFEVNGMRYATAYSRSNTWRIEKWQVRHMENTLIVSDFFPEVNSGHKRKVRDWISHVAWKGGTEPGYIIFTAASKVDSPWVDKTRIVSWEKIKTEAPKKERISRAGQGSGRVAGSWDYYTIDGRQYEKPLPKTGKVFYVISAEVPIDDYARIINLMKVLGLDADAAVIRVGLNRLDKFKRENPKVEEFLGWGKAQVNMKPVDLLSDDAKTILTLDYNERRALSGADATKIIDPEWKRLAKLLKKESELTKAYESALALARWFGLWYDVKRFEKDSTKSPMHDRYPLLHEFSFYSSVHPDVYLYINAKYKQLKKEKKV